jgi:hypothetical protein
MNFQFLQLIYFPEDSSPEGNVEPRGNSNVPQGEPEDVVGE